MAWGCSSSVLSGHLTIVYHNVIGKIFQLMEVITLLIKGGKLMEIGNPAENEVFHGKSSVNREFSIAILNYRRVSLWFYPLVIPPDLHLHLASEPRRKSTGTSCDATPIQMPLISPTCGTSWKAMP